MCQQCMTNAQNYGELLPGWYLMRAQNDGTPMMDDKIWKAGMWGLVWSNDPLTIWSSTGTPNPAFGLDDKAEEELWEANKDNEIGKRIVLDLPDDFEEAFASFSPLTGYDLITAAMQRGYDPEKSGDLSWWLFDWMGEFLKTATPRHHGAVD